MSKDADRIRKNLEQLANRSFQEEAELVKIEREAIARFTGQWDDLEAALGMLRLGHHTGWRVLVLIHNKRTIRRYEEILGISVREYFEPDGPSCDRSKGYVLAKRLGNFWKAVSGATKIEDRRVIAGEVLEEV